MAKMLAENVEALVGGQVNFDLIPKGSDEMASTFGGQSLYVFPIEDHHGNPFPSLLAFTFDAALYMGGAFSLMGPEQIKEILLSGEVPEILHDSIGEVANIICGAATNMIRMRVAEAPQFRRGAAFRRVETGPWPALLAEFGPRVPWEIACCRLSMGGEDRGAILFSASDLKEGQVTKEEIIAVAGPDPNPPPPELEEEEEEAVPEVPEPEMAAPPPPPLSIDRPRIAEAASAPPEGIRVLVTGHPADPAAAGLRSVLEAAGLHVLPAFSSSSEQTAPPDAMFVVSRSPVDLSIRLERVPKGRRPAMVIACSDRPTRDLVVAARNAGADAFVVLPAIAERIWGLLNKLPTPA